MAGNFIPLLGKCCRFLKNEIRVNDNLPTPHYSLWKWYYFFKHHGLADLEVLSQIIFYILLSFKNGGSNYSIIISGNYANTIDMMIMPK